MNDAARSLELEVPSQMADSSVAIRRTVERAPGGRLAVHRRGEQDLVAIVGTRDVPDLIDDVRQQLQARSAAPGARGVLRWLAKPVVTVLEAEVTRWDALLRELPTRVERQELTEPQRRLLVDLWTRGVAAVSTLRRPAVGVSPDGSLQLGWSFDDRPQVLSIDIGREGQIEWYFRDRTSGRSEGTEDEGSTSFPERAYWLLITNFGLVGPAR